MVYSRNNDENDLHNPYNNSSSIGNGMGVLSATDWRSDEDATFIGVVVAVDAVAADVAADVAAAVVPTTSTSILKRNGVDIVTALPASIRHMDATTRYRTIHAI